MDMHKAALPPLMGVVTEKDRRHPRFREYDEYRRGCRRLMINYEGFRDWLAAREHEEKLVAEAQHPRFAEFQAWMQATKAGGRKCPVSNTFPINFRFWLQGGRW